MKPSKLYEKDYLILSNDEANEKADYLKSVETIDIAIIKSYSELSLAVRHNLSLFPNNLVVLQDEKDPTDALVCKDCGHIELLIDWDKTKA